MQFTSKDIIEIKQEIKPGLYLVSTPIGNLGDITLRAIYILKSSELVLCEDTRNSQKLLKKFGINTKLMSYHKFNERKKSGKIIELLKNNKIISLISDAGTPVISDPGNVLVKECIINGISVYPVPGPSSITSAFSVSGFEEKFFFYGFLKKTEVPKSPCNILYTHSTYCSNIGLSYPNCLYILTRFPYSCSIVSIIF